MTSAKERSYRLRRNWLSKFIRKLKMSDPLQPPLTDFVFTAEEE